MIIPEAKNVTAPDDFTHCQAFSGSVLGLRNTEAASLVVLAAIRESMGSARINLAEILSGYGATPQYNAREEIKKSILAVHKRVTERLSNPVTELEKQAAGAVTLTEEAKEYWLKPLPFPDVADLPEPSKEYIDAVDRMVMASGEVCRLMAPYATPHGMSPIPEDARAMIRTTLDIAHETNAEIDAMREMGLIGEVRSRQKPQGPKISG